MNDFTKEELENILNGNIELYPATFSGLRNKIQSMIDTYCDHNWENYCCGCDAENLACTKCDRDLWGRKLC